MIKLFLIVCILSILEYTCSRKGKSTKQSEALAKADTIKVLVAFDPDIKSILKTHCTPCHFPGGSMYARLPFDNPQTIRDHPDGIFRRIKDPEEVKKLKAFLDQKNL